MRKLLLIILLISFKSFGQTLEADRLALVAIYNQANGADWVVNWVVPGNPGDSPCGWDGVTCAGGRVAKLDIMNLKPVTLSPEIGKLTELTHLNLSTEYLGPGFIGEIPSEIGNLSKLEYLSLEGNSFNSNNLSVIGNLTKLKELFLTLSVDVPASFANLVNLERCMMGKFGPLEGNATIAFPEAIYQWPKIKLLRMAGVNFTTPMSSQIGNLTALDTLELTGAGRFGGPASSVVWGDIPAEMGNLTNLKYLRLAYSGLTGTIPASFNNLTNLTLLDLSHNTLTGPIPNILGIPVAADVRINDNAFNFSGMETNISRLDHYAPQASIRGDLAGPLCIYCEATEMWVATAGGTQANNTYKLYKNNVLSQTRVGNYVLPLDGQGIYYAEVTNSAVPGLTLRTQTFVSIVLPVTLVSFEGKTENGQTKLTWKTTSETNNKGFEIERSADARAFEKIGFKDGSGDTKEDQFYHFTDLNPLATSYYRLKQLDYDGRFEYSKVIAVMAGRELINIYPNPAQTELRVEGATGAEVVSVFTPTGKLVVANARLSGGKLDVKDLKEGIYTIKIGDIAKKLLIKR